jgi:hypothetical protein
VSPPYTISISGEWGVGKTTLMDQMLDAMRKADEKALAVRLDLWCADIDDLRRAIAIEVGAVSKIGTKLLAEGGSRAEQARDHVAGELDSAIHTTVTKPELSIGFQENLRKPTSWLAVGLAAIALMTLFWAGSNAPKPWDAFALAVIPIVFTGAVIMAGLGLGVVTTSRSIAPAAERVGLGKELRGLVSGKKGSKVIVIIDNLDRLAGQDALTTLSDIRTFVEIPAGRCVFVIPIDRDAFIRHCESQHMSEEVARDYLEKFFNLNVLLTKPAEIDLRSWTFDLVVEYAGKDRDPVQVAEIIADAADGSPRTAKRILSGTIARYLLLDQDHRNAIRLPQIAFMEALVARFPFVLKTVGPDPRLLVQARNDLANALDDQGRMNAISCLNPEPETSEGRIHPWELRDLRSFLLTHRAISLTRDEVGLILSLRGDRDWHGIDGPDTLRAALRTGDPTAFADDLAKRDDASRVAVLSRATVLVRQDCQSGWLTGAINGLNALIPSLDPAADHSDLRDAARGVLQRITEPEQMAALSVKAIEFLCHPLDADQRLLAAVPLAEAAIRGRDSDRFDVTSPIEFVKVMSPLFTRGLSSIRDALATRTPEELAPLYVPGDHVRLLLDGPVVKRDYDLVASWDLASDNQFPQMGPCLDRLALVKDFGMALPDAQLAVLLPRLSGQIASASAIWLGCFEKLVPLLADRPPSELIDNLGYAWSSWPQATGDGLRLALALPLQSPMSLQIQKVASSWMLTGAHDEVVSFVHGVRDRFGSLVNDALAERWIATKEARAADLAAEGGDSAIMVLIAKLDTSPPAAGPYLTFLQQLVEVVLGRRSTEGAAALVDLMGRHFGAVEPANASAFAPVLERLCQLEVDGAKVHVDVDPVVSALEARLKNVPEAALPAFAAAAKDFDERGLDPTGRLAIALVARCRELQRIDWTTADWLAQHGAITPTMFIDALVHSIERDADQIEAVVPRLPALRRPLLANPRVTEAVVVRIAKCPNDQVRPLLEQLAGWKRPKHPGSAYLEAIRKIGEELPGLLGELGF